MWIEIRDDRPGKEEMESRLARALWIEIRGLQVKHKQLMSRLARALWIEILVPSCETGWPHVEARESLVD